MLRTVIRIILLFFYIFFCKETSTCPILPTNEENNSLKFPHKMHLYFFIHHTAKKNTHTHTYTYLISTQPNIYFSSKPQHAMDLPTLKNAAHNNDDNTK